jgi:hypothetical protein
MKPRIHICFCALLLTFFSAESQRFSKSDKLTLANLQTEMQALAADTADGRAMGSPGEKATGDFVISGLSKSGARPKGDNSGWLQTFTIDDGREVVHSLFSVDDHALTIMKDWFPLVICPAGEVSGSPAIALQESGVPWFLDLKETLENGADNPHFDLGADIRDKAAACAKKGATALILYNSSAHHPDKLSFDPKDKPEPAVIPVVYITREAKRKYLKDESASFDIKIRIGYTEKTRTGHNVVGFLDNGAATTAIISTRYDNSSGLAGMIELARLLAASKLKANNYLFLVFSGSGSGWLGSEYYASHPATDLKKVNYVFEFDRLDALDNTTHALTIGGYETSPSWSSIGGGVRDKKAVSCRYDSSAGQPGDHLVFRRQQIPILVFSTAPRPAGNPIISVSGEVQVLKYIYSLMEAANARGKLVFTP